MKTQICTKCRKRKPVNEFYYDKKGKFYRASCRRCGADFKKEDRKLRPWTYVYLGIKKRCEYKFWKAYKDYGAKGIKCLITVDEIKELWFRDKAYLMKWATIDRKDKFGHYTFDNCQFLEHAENTAKDKRKPVLQFDKQGNFIKEWISATDAAKTLNYCQSEINRAINNKRNKKSAYGFIWKLK